MNYYHIIYTSSQKGLNGSNGFGIRTATAGTPKEYLQAIVSGVAAGKFSNVITNCNPPSIEEMLKNKGEAVHRVPPRYFMMKIEVAGGKAAYVLGRNVYLGFTESFYAKDKDGNISGAGGRQGNYFIDFYVFDELPPVQVFLLLYESPEVGQGRFIPMEAAPNTENFEVAKYAVGEPEELPVDDKSFNYPLPESLSDKLADFLFAYVDARLKGVQLFVKYPWKKTHSLLADAVKLLPEEEFERLTFSTNYNGNGYQAPVELLFANEYYKLDRASYAGGGVFIDLEREQPDTDESKAFGQCLRAAISANDRNKAAKLVKWMLSSTYKYSKEKHLSPHTNEVLFCYSQTPEEFNLALINKEPSVRDELVDALILYFKRKESSGNRFFHLMEEKIANASTIDSILTCIEELEYYQGKQLNISGIINSQKIHIEDIIMESADNANTAISVLGLPTVRKYTRDLQKGRSWDDLADSLLAIWAESKPTTLDDAELKLQKALNENVSLYNLIIKNFSTLYDNVYNHVNQSLNGSNLQTIAGSLKSKLIDPLHEELCDNVLFQEFNLLYEVAAGHAGFVNRSNYEKILSLVEKLCLLHSDLGQDVKKFLIESSAVADTVSKLRTVWGMNTADIVREVGGNIRCKEYIREALESDREMKLADVMKMLGEQRFSNDDIADLLKGTKRYASAYKAYSRKNAISGFFKKILSLFKSRKKEERKSAPTKKDSDSTSKQDVTPAVIISAPKRTLSEQDYKNVEESLNNPDMPISDVVKENVEYVKERFENAKQKGQQVPKELKRFEKYFFTLLLFFLSPFAFSDASADTPKTYRTYGDHPEERSYCFVVSQSNATVRTSASIYRSDKKLPTQNERKDNIVVDIPLQKGDTIFISHLSEVLHNEGIIWLKFSHNGNIYYIDKSTLVPATNVHYLGSLKEEQTGGAFLGWVRRSAPWFLLILTILFFACTFEVWKENKESLTGEARSDTGMKPYFVFSLRPYKFFAGLSGRILLAVALSIIVLFILGGIVWGALWVLKILMWIIIIVGWLLLLCSLIACFIAFPWGLIVGIIMMIIGYLVVHNQKSISAFGNSCVEAGENFFGALNLWQFTLDLIQDYWVIGLTIALAPLVLFIVVAILILAVAGILRAYEAITTHRYNMKHPCPYCHEPSEPAIYYDGARKKELPISLRPGIYGLLHITHPVTGKAMPTMLANGRDRCSRKCPHCGHFINFETGTEKHIGFVGMPDSGKTALLCSVIGNLKKVYPQLHFTDRVDEDVLENVKYAYQQGHLDDLHLPFKTGCEWKSSIQCILPRNSGGMPFHLYFNDVSGELFTTGGNDSNLLRFAQDVEDIIFIIDPWTVNLDKKKISERMKTWLKRDDVAIWQGSKQLEDITDASNSIVNILTNSKRNLAKIHFTFVLTKSDTGYLAGINSSDENALKSFIEEDLCLQHLVYNIESQFQSVSYIASSVYMSDDPGVQKLCRDLAKRLQLDL